MKTSAFFAFLFAVVPTMARPNMRSLYRVDLGAEVHAAAAAANSLEFGSWRKLVPAMESSSSSSSVDMSMPIETIAGGLIESSSSSSSSVDMSMPVQTDFSFPMSADMSMPIDTDFSFPMETGMSFPFDTDFSIPMDAEMSMPYACDTFYECPAEDTCDCNGNVQDGGDICGCYTITSVPAPFDTVAVPPSGTWYCYQMDLDKTADGCSGAKAISHSVLATGFSETCLFHPGGLDVGGSDDWDYQTCDNTAATGLKYDFGHTGDSDQLSVTYCFDVSCEAAPAGEGSIDWVIKASNDRCEITVTDGAIPNCGVSSDLCSPSCPADSNGGNGGGNNGGGNGGGNNGGNANNVNEPGANTNAAPVEDGGSDGKNLGAIIGPIVGVAAVAAIAGVAYLKAKSGAAAGADAASLSSADTPPVVA